MGGGGSYQNPNFSQIRSRHILPLNDNIIIRKLTISMRQIDKSYASININLCTYEKQLIRVNKFVYYNSELKHVLYTYRLLTRTKITIHVIHIKTRFCYSFHIHNNFLIFCIKLVQNFPFHMCTLLH